MRLMHNILHQILDFNDKNSISSSFRQRRFDLFKRLLPLRPGGRILDLGGSESFWVDTEFTGSVTILNLELPQSQNSQFEWIRGDACDLSMFADKSFEIVFSNSVIEHVGNFTRQRMMAQEVKRVARSYWVQTPNRHFPIEPHFLFPFFQYLPYRVRLGVAKHWPLSYSRLLSLDAEREVSHIWLLNRKEMAELFDDAQILNEKVFGLTKSFIAVRQL